MAPNLQPPVALYSFLMLLYQDVCTARVLETQAIQVVVTHLQQTLFISGMCGAWRSCALRMLVERKDSPQEVNRPDVQARGLSESIMLDYTM
jgi:hypothetical protein